MKKNIIIVLVFLFSVIFISGCINISLTPEDESIAPGKGRLKIYLTDSSEDYKASNAENYLAVNKTISKIQVHKAGEDEGTEGEWIEWELNESFNLIVLKEEDLLELLIEDELDLGKYTQIRLFITEATVLVDDEVDSDPLEIPSNLQTGLKLIHPFEIIDGEPTILTIDFDAEKSIIKTGNEKYILKPTIKVITN